MLSIFDWLRLSRTGSELLATLEYTMTAPDLFPQNDVMGSPFTLIRHPCQRCWIYPCIQIESLESESGDIQIGNREDEMSALNYCRTCLAILNRAKYRGQSSRHTVVIWGYVTMLPVGLSSGKGFYDKEDVGIYIHDNHRFLLVMNRWRLREWLQETLIYHGTDLKGLIQIFPTTAQGRKGGMGDMLCRAVYHEARYPADMLRIRFFSKSYQLLSPRKREDEGLLTFEVTEFLRLLEMATIFRSLLKPEEQQMLYELIKLKNFQEEQFYWGRFMGRLNQKAKDMLNSWKIRQWSKRRIQLLYELVDYVFYII